MADFFQSCRRRKCENATAVWRWAALILALTPTLSLSAGTVSVNGATTYQTIDGFGAATVWNGISTAQAPILWTDDSSFSVANTTAHVNGHYGLSTLRTRIDPGAEGDTREDGTISSSGNWNGELNQVILALKTNSNIRVYATPWTPPAPDKECNCTSTTGNTNSFLGMPTDVNGTAGQAAADTDYADYLVAFTKYFKTYVGTTLWAISCQNEPDFNPTNYESALWTGQQFDTFVGSYLGPAMQSAGLLSQTKIMMTESFGDNLGLAATTMNDANAAPYVGIIGGHLYGAAVPPNTLPSQNWSHLTNQHYWETEISDGGDTDGHETAQWIHDCIVDAGMNSMNHWWISAGDATELYDTATNQWSPPGFVEGLWSKFVRPGFIRISATEYPEGGTKTPNAPMWCSAFESPTQNRVVVVAYNDSTTSSYTETFNLSGLGSVPEVAPWLSNATTDLVQQPLVVLTANSFSYTIPPRSGVCFVGDIGNPPTPSLTPSASSTFTASPTSTHTPTATRTPSPIPTPGPCQYIAAVDSGATAAYTSNLLGLTFGADQQYVPGSAPGATGSFGYVSWAAGTAYTSTTTITGGDSVDATLYNTQRYGATLGYDFSVPNGPAYVTLYWAETYATAVGQRVFSVTINGVTEESALDLYAVAGSNATYIATFPVTVTGGLISVVATASANNAEFQGISVQAGPGCTPTPTITHTFSASPTSTVTRSTTRTDTVTATPTVSSVDTATSTLTMMPSQTPSSIATATLTWTETPSSTKTLVNTATSTVTLSQTSSAVDTATVTSSVTPSSSMTQVDTATATGTVTGILSHTFTTTPSVSATVTATPPPSMGWGIVSPNPLVGPASGGFPVSVSVTGVSSNTLYVDFLGTTVTATVPTTVGSGGAGITLLGATVPNLSPFEASQATGVAIYIVPSNGGAKILAGTITLKALTLTPSPTSVNGSLMIQRILGVPNPNPNALAVDLDGFADGVEFKVFTKGLLVVENFQVGALSQGWHEVPLPSAWYRLPNGLYYVLAQAHRGGTLSSTRFVKVLILR